MKIVRMIPRGDALGRRGLFSGKQEQVGTIIGDVREGGDRELIDWTAQLDGMRPTSAQLRVSDDASRDALDALGAEVRTALETSMRNVRTVVEAQLRAAVDVALPEGQRVEIVERPVASAGVYAPGGRAAYPSSVVMCAVTARASGVERIAVCSPPQAPGQVHPVVLAACALCEVDEVYAIGGAQAIAALAHGTETVAKVDVVVGPGNYWVTEAKRQLVGRIGIDGLAGPSELVVVAGADACPDAELIALDLLAQAEHGPDSFVCVLSPAAELLEAVVGHVQRLAPERPSVTDVELVAVQRPSMEESVAFAEEMAPEHLELIGDEAEAFAGEIRSAGCLFVGRNAATAFGDYVAGSNHVLPTGGAARFQSALSPATFRRRMARVSLPGEAAARLAPAGAALARAEGFPVHAESMERRA